MFNYSYSSNLIVERSWLNMLSKHPGLEDKNVLKSFFKDGAAQVASICFSDLEPPKKFHEREKPDYEIMGEYRADTQTIILYIGPIGHVAFEHKIDVHILTHLVIMHELGHLASHILFKRLRDSDIKLLYEIGCDETKLSSHAPWNLEHFQKSNKYVIEWLAQMYCRFAIDWNKSFKEAFYMLAEKQSAEYQTFRAFDDLPFETLFDCNLKLAELNRPANPDDVGDILSEYIGSKDFYSITEKIRNRVAIFFNTEQKMKNKSTITAVKYGVLK